MLTLGDTCGHGSNCTNGCCAGAAVLLNPDTTDAVAFTASIGLPPVYLYETRDLAVLTSAPALIPALLRRALTLDPDGVIDLLSIGYPLERRTLYHFTSLVPPATSCRISVNERSTCRSITTPLPIPEATPPTPSTDRGSAEFLGAVQSRDLSQSVLSLTGGLDTRAIAAALKLLDLRLPAVTLIGGMRPSLDAIIARRLASDIGIPHDTISLGRAFSERLPHYTAQASLLSSGLISVAGAHEAYFAEQVRTRAASRLSGIAGNQLARCGVEAVRPRSADLALLARPFLVQGRNGRGADHMHQDLPRNPASLRAFLLTHELPQSLQALFQIAHTHSIQQIPYADAALARAVPVQAFPRSATPGPLALRLRDIRHRFLGEYYDRSFQVDTIRRAGPPLATLPINWGWTVVGRYSLEGLLLGSRAAADAALGRSSSFRGLRRACRIEGLHMLYDVSDWLGGPLREFTYDTLLSQSVRTCGVLDVRRLDRLLADNTSRTPRDCTGLTAALDVALAMRWTQPSDSSARAAAFGSFITS